MAQSPSPEKRLANNAGAGCLRGLVLQLAVVLFGVPPIVVVLGGVLALADNGRPFLAVAVGIFGIYGLVAVVGGAAFAWNQSWLRGLDPAFAALGDVNGAMFMQNGRQWRGEVAGRRLDAYLYRGPILELYLSADVRSRFTAGWPGVVSGLLAGALGRESLTGLDGFGDLAVFPSDPTWARDVLAEARAKVALPRLLADRSSTGIRVVQVLPDAVMLRVAHLDLADARPDVLRSWVEDLAALATAAEAVRPAKELEATAYEVSNRTARGAVAVRISVAIFLGFGLGFVVALAGALFAAFLVP